MTAKDRATLKAENAADLPDNVARLISPADLRGQMDDIVDSAVFPEDGGGGGGSGGVVTITATTRTLAPADHNKILDCTNPAGCLVTVPLGLTSGTGVLFTCWLSRGAGAGILEVWEGVGCTVEAPNGYLVLDEEFGRMTLVEWPDGTFRLYDGTLAPGSIPVNTALPVITGLAEVEETLTASTGTWTGDPVPTYTYQWKSSGVVISGATAAAYVLQALDVDDMITVTITAANASGSASATSAAVGPVEALDWPVEPFLEYYPSEADAVNGVMPRHGSIVPIDDKEIAHTVKGTGIYLLNNSVTATYGSHTGPEGLQTAHRIISTGGGQAGIFTFTGTVAVAAGQTVSFLWDIRTTPGATAAQMLQGGPSVGLVVVSATATWQSVKVTVTPGSPTNYSFWITRNGAGETPFDVLIDNIRVVKGAVAIPYPPVDGHVVFGPVQGYSGNPTFAGGVIAETPVAGVIELAVAKTFSELTFMFAGRHLTNVVSGYKPVLSAGAFANFFGSIGAGGLGGGGAQFQAVGSTSTPSLPYHYSKGKGWMTVGFKIKDGKQDILVNGAIYAATDLVASFPGFTNKFMEMFGLGGSSTITGYPGDIGPVVVFDSYLDDVQVGKADRYLRSVAEDTGIAFATDILTYYANGDSITNQNSFVGASGGVGSHAHRVLKARPTQLTGCVVAAGGSSIEGLIDDLEEFQFNAMQHLVLQGQKVILSPLPGANDPPIIATPEVWYNDLITRIYRPARARGVKVMAHTVLPKENVGAWVGHNAGRAVVNNLIRSHPEEWDALVDFDTKPVGQDGAPAARVLYFDGVHPNGLGYDDMEVVEVAALDGLIASLS